MVLSYPAVEGQPPTLKGLTMVGTGLPDPGFLLTSTTQIRGGLVLA